MAAGRTLGPGSKLRAPLSLFTDTKKTAVQVFDSSGNLIAPIATTNTSGGATAGARQFARVAIANAAVLTLHSAPSLLVAAPGAGNVIEVESIWLNNLFLTGAYTGGGVIQGAYGIAGTVQATDTVAATFLTSPVANQLVNLVGKVPSALSSAVLNTGLYLAAATADFAAGAGSLVVLVEYRIISGLA